MNTNVYNIEESRRRAAAAERPLAHTLHDTIHELKIFAETRVAMLQSEMREKMQSLKAAAPMLIIGAVVAATAFLLFTAAFVAVITVAFAGSVYAPFLACIIVAVVYAIIGGGVLWVGYGKITAEGIMPERTLNVLREDKVWLENEARTQL